MKGTLPTYISVSSINDFQADRLRWCMKWVANRVPRKQADALTVGKAVHAAFEAHLTSPGRSVGEHLGDIAGTEHIEPKALEEIIRLCEPLSLWRDEFPIQRTLEVETPFEWDLPCGLKFRGRPDRVVLVFDQVFHFQHKTLASSANVSTFLSGARRNLHELLYGIHLAEKYNEWSYGGTIYNIIRKLKYRHKTTGEILHTSCEMFVQTMLGTTQQEQVSARADMYWLAEEMQETAETYLNDFFAAIPSTRTRDNGPFGNSPCPYTLVMLGEADLFDDEMFTVRLDTYDNSESRDDSTA